MPLQSGEHITFWNCLFQLFAVGFDRLLRCPGFRQTCKINYLFRPKEEYLSNSNFQPPTWPYPFVKMTRCQIVQNSPIVQTLILCCLSIQAAATSFLLLEYAIGGKSPQRPPSKNTLKVFLSIWRPLRQSNHQPMCRRCQTSKWIFLQVSNECLRTCKLWKVISNQYSHTLALPEPAIDSPSTLYEIYHFCFSTDLTCSFLMYTAYFFREKNILDCKSLDCLISTKVFHEWPRRSIVCAQDPLWFP